MKPVPLFRRALDQREREQEAQAEEQRNARAREGIRLRLEAGRPWGKFRLKAVPKVGDVFGNARVVASGVRGRCGRADLSFECECTVCGRKGPVFEFNLRKNPRCVGGRVRHA